MWAGATTTSLAIHSVCTFNSTMLGWLVGCFMFDDMPSPLLLLPSLLCSLHSVLLGYENSIYSRFGFNLIFEKQQELCVIKKWLFGLPVSHKFCFISSLRDDRARSLTGLARLRSFWSRVERDQVNLPSPSCALCMRSHAAHFTARSNHQQSCLNVTSISISHLATSISFVVKWSSTRV